VTAQLDASRKSDKRESAELEGLREKKVDAEMKVKKLEEEAKTSRKEADRREKDLQVAAFLRLYVHGAIIPFC
jgi:hypothetical protein